MLNKLQSATWLPVTLIAVALYFTGGILISLPFTSTSTFLFWPPAGFAFAALWWFGKRAIPGIVIGSLLVSVFIAKDTHTFSITPIAFAVVLEAILPTMWLKHQNITDIFADTESVLKFILFAVIISPAITAALGVSIMWANGLQHLTTLHTAWLSWWVGDSMGVLLIAPFLLSLKRLKKTVLSALNITELLGVALLLLWLWSHLFMATPSQNLPPLSFITIPLIIWVAVRFNITVLTTVVGILSLIAVSSTATGHGPFVRASLAEGIAYLYGFLGVVAAIGLFLNASLNHSRRSMKYLAEINMELQASEEGLRKTLENTPNVAVQWFDKHGQVLYWNTASETLYGWSKEEAMGKTLDQLIYTPEAAEHFSSILAVIAKSDTMVGPIESTITHRTGKTGNIISTIFAMPETDGMARRFVCIDVDITKVKQAEAALISSHRQLAKAQRIAKLGSWQWDILADKVTGSDESFRIYGLEPTPETSFSVGYNLVHPDDKDAYLNAVTKHFTYPNMQSELEFRIIRTDGEIRTIRSYAEITYNENHKAILAEGTFQDITELQQTKAEIERLAYYDELTGLPNRRMLLKLLTEHMETARANNHHIALLFVDIDHFKTLNDTHGHETGDFLLKEVATRIKQCLYKEAIVARPGGDEFGIILPTLGNSVEQASKALMDAAERIRDTLTVPFDFGDHFYHSSASIGAVIYPAGKTENTLHDLLKQADTALFKSKDTGRNAISLFAAHMQDEVNARLAIEQDLREAIAKDELRLYLQPQINMHGETVGAECLLRWQHTIHGLVSPVTFIPVAESTGLIVSIGKWVLHQACLVITRLDSTNPRIRISVNVSPRQFRQPTFVQQVKEILQSTGADPHRLVLEITESVVVENVNEVIARMQELQNIGVGFSIDDFGTGYSSLSYLKHLPLRELKIDKSFVDGLPHNRDDGAIVGSILALARNLGLEVVAEGIETIGQMEYLKAHGCQIFQGYLHGKPVMSEEFITERLDPKNANLRDNA